MYSIVQNMYVKSDCTLHGELVHAAMKAGIGGRDHYYTWLWPYIKLHKMHSGEQMAAASWEDPEDSQFHYQD